MKKLNTNLIIGIVLTLLVSTPVVLSFFWLPYDVNVMDYSAILEAPSLAHPFGTDNFGRDIFCRVAQGTRATLLISVLTVFIGALIGSLIGAFTGYFGGIADEILMRVNDCLASFPSILLALVVVSILDKGTLNICIALGLVFIPSYARIMRSEVLSQRNLDYVTNARLMGAGDLRIIFIHILPNTLPVLLSSVLVGLNNAVLAEAGLSYLGLGVQPPDPSLGRMLSEAQVYIFGAPWYVIFTSLSMVMAILGITLISENVGVQEINLKKIYKKYGLNRDTQSQDTSAGAGQSSDSSNALLKVSKLSVGFVSTSGINEVLHGMDFELKKGEILGIVGESGSGKSMTALSVMSLAPDTSVVTGGDVLLQGRSILNLSEHELSMIRGRQIAMIFQEPMTSLNPVQTVGEQIDEVLDLHAGNLTAGEQRQRVLEAMDDTGLENPDELYNKYPHELSGGMRQRIMIAMAIVSGVDIILADEPTTALDADVAGVILDIFRRVNNKYRTSIILISHDLEIISQICSRTLIVKDGSIVEELAISGPDCFEEPQTEYGQRLLAAAYADKSYVAENEVMSAGFAAPQTDPLVHIEGLNVYYPEYGKSIFDRMRLKQVNFDISFDIHKGDCLGLVGRSGCGKTTLVKAIAGLQRYTDGVMSLNCARPGMVFQDPMSSLNPAMTVGRILEEPLRIHGGLTKEQRRAQVRETLGMVELEESLSTRMVSELSGGQRQRISIALNIILNRELIILDEPVSALDVTIREQILELLMRLKAERGLTFIVISHDKRLVSRVCNRIYSVEDGHAVKIR